MSKHIKLDGGASRAALETAARTQAQVILESPAFGEATINGYLLTADETALLVEVTGHPSLSMESLVNTACDAQLYSDERYQFGTRIMGVPTWGRTQAVALARPGVIQMMERRRFLRAKLAPSSRVMLSWRAGEGPHQHFATLLNVSPDGLACRIEEGAAEAVSRGEALSARFELPGFKRSFVLPAEVRNRTPGSEGFVILGLHFSLNGSPAEEVETLRRALAGHGASRREAEATA